MKVETGHDKLQVSPTGEYRVDQLWFTEEVRTLT